MAGHLTTERKEISSLTPSGKKNEYFRAVFKRMELRYTCNTTQRVLIVLENDVIKILKGV